MESHPTQETCLEIDMKKVQVLLLHGVLGKSSGDFTVLFSKYSCFRSTFITRNPIVGFICGYLRYSDLYESIPLVLSEFRAHHKQ